MASVSKALKVTTVQTIDKQMNPLSSNGGMHKTIRPKKFLTAISLFSGGGGLDLGIEKAGFRTLACIEKDPHCCTTLTNNQPKYLKHAKIINADVNDVDVKQLMRNCQLEAGELDLLFGGPPCQSFSQIGKLGSLNDVRGALLFTMVNYAKVLRPKAIVIENVKALLSAKNLAGEKGGVVEDLKNALEKLGYNVCMQVLNAVDFGVAQKRQRLFIVGVRNGETFHFPTSNGELNTVGNVLARLPKPAGKEKEPRFPNHVDVTPAGDRNRISYVNEGEYLAKSAHAPPSVKGKLSAKDTTKFLRVGRNKQSNTLRCGEIFFHPIEDRYLTPREYMRIHGFPDDYVLQGPIRGRSGSVRDLDQHRQVANSVPPPVAFEMGKMLIKEIFKSKKLIQNV